MSTKGAREPHRQGFRARWPGALLLALLCPAVADAGSLVVSAEEYGDEWPFAPDSVRLVCDEDVAIYVEHDGRRYGLNGLAREKGYADPEDLRRIDEAARAERRSTFRSWKAQHGPRIGELMFRACDSPWSTTTGGLYGVRRRGGGYEDVKLPLEQCPPYDRLGDVYHLESTLRRRAYDVCP